MPKCPSQERLLSYETIPDETSKSLRLWISVHLLMCHGCRDTRKKIRETWDAYFSQPLDVTSSLIRVLGRLQKDETLILKGWKLGRSRRPVGTEAWLRQGWVFRGGVVAGLAGIAFLLVSNSTKMEPEVALRPVPQSATIPLTEIREEAKHGVKVHYVQPQLLQSIEFETMSTR